MSDLYKSRQVELVGFLGNSRLFLRNGYLIVEPCLFFFFCAREKSKSRSNWNTLLRNPAWKESLIRIVSTRWWLHVYYNLFSECVVMATKCVSAVVAMKCDIICNVLVMVTISKVAFRVTKVSNNIMIIWMYIWLTTTNETTANNNQ